MLDLELEQINSRIIPADDTSMNKARSNWDKIAKPLGSLGVLEDYVVKLSGIQGTDAPKINKRCAVIMCADNGVVAEGVSQSTEDVTSSVALDICKGTSNINVMAAAVNTDVVAVDMGMKNEVAHEKLIDKRISAGTDNITKGPAMDEEKVLQAIYTGIEIVKNLKDKGYDIVITGEMGIGNTTTASALAAVLLDMEVATVTGRGAGLSNEGLVKKIAAIETAIEVNKARDITNVIKLLATLGGYDIAALTGMYIGGAIHRVPIVIDGFISLVAALVAVRFNQDVRGYMLASHISKEPAARMILEELKLGAIIDGGLRLGEGTGAVCLLPLLDIALAEYRNAHRFADTDIEQYEVLS